MKASETTPELLLPEEALVERILDLKEKRNAVILAHNYQRPEVQDLGDFVGDSLGLARQAARTDAEVIVFCGVHFMAETASILCPDRVVVLPDLNAGCPMADMAAARDLKRFRENHPGVVVVSYVNTTAAVKALSDYCCTSSNAVEVVVVSYVNTTAAVKALSDYCCTSSNAVEVVRRVEGEEILFLPDRNLAAYVADRVPEKRIIPWDGYCHVHQGIRREHVEEAKRLHPEAEVIAHPECTREVLELADHIRSTSGMVEAARDSEAEEFIVATESGMFHPLRKALPHKRFHPPMVEPLCPNMKLITLSKVLRSLETLHPQVKVPEAVRVRALQAVERMLVSESA